MEKSEKSRKFKLELTITQYIEACHRVRALQTAEFQLSRDTIRLREVIFTDEHFHQRRAEVVRVEGLKWTEVEWAGWHHAFIVQGTLSVELECYGYSHVKSLFLPQSVLLGLPVLTIPAEFRSIPVQVVDYHLEIMEQTEIGESAA